MTSLTSRRIEECDRKIVRTPRVYGNAVIAICFNPAAAIKFANNSDAGGRQHTGYPWHYPRPTTGPSSDVSDRVEIEPAVFAVGRRFGRCLFVVFCPRPRGQYTPAGQQYSCHYWYCGRVVLFDGTKRKYLHVHDRLPRSLDNSRPRRHGVNRFKNTEIDHVIPCVCVLCFIVRRDKCYFIFNFVSVRVYYHIMTRYATDWSKSLLQ